MAVAKRNKKLIIFALLVACVLFLNHKYGLIEKITAPSSTAYMEQMIKENYTFAVGLYILLTIVGCVLLALPGVSFAVIAGMLFGPWLGTLYCLLATTIGAMAAFVCGRFFLKETLKPIVMKNGPIRRLLFENTEENEVLILFITRILPIFPYNLQNFAYGVTDISFRKYSICTFLFMLPGVALFTIGTVGIMDEQNRMLYICIAVMLIVFLGAIGRFLKKRRPDMQETLKEVK